MKVVSRPVQMIEKNGNFNSAELKRLCSEVSGSACNKPCTVVSIIGPQHSARCNNSGMIIMDVEGSDSGDRALEGTSFENKISLFALATSDAMLLNVKVQDFGKYNAGCRPLLNIIFQERAKLTQRKTKVIIVFRDCKRPDKVKENCGTVYSTLKEIWLAVHPDDRNSPKFDDYIEANMDDSTSLDTFKARLNVLLSSISTRADTTKLKLCDIYSVAISNDFCYFLNLRWHYKLHKIVYVT
ncbi:hypothetical protein LUZ62_014927 [Rhynchospora pubera]|uniref:Uncharacterized protein n=1 Tax=Rhynchospora pubera TaxID=906938 RepID=A0AAV8GG66_9POAL|nr:hypothetical protein LUZ62_014927 [Rhynchospora pubera]